MQPFIRLMKALSDPNRVKIVKLLQHRSGMCVCELTSLLQIAQPTVSKHLKILEEAGLVTSSKEGLWVNYALAGGSSPNPYAAAIIQKLAAWLEDEPAVAEVLEKAPFASRERICAQRSIR